MIFVGEVSQSLQDQGTVRISTGSASTKTTGLNPFKIRVPSEFENGAKKGSPSKSQSLQDQGTVRICLSATLKPLSRLNPFKIRVPSE